jgi:hypothetical protein
VQTKKNERTKVYLIIALGAVFCAVGYFRFFYKSHNRAAGAAQVSASAALPLVVPAIALTLQGNQQDPSRHEATRDVVRDIFEPGRSVRRSESNSKASTEIAPKPLQLTLTGMVYDTSKPVAIINGQFMRPGDRIGDYKVTRIGPKEVYVQGEDREIVLRIIDSGKN